MRSDLSVLNASSVLVTLVLLIHLFSKLSMMEDPTAHNDKDEDYEDEKEEDITLRRLYLFNLPTEIKESCTYLINWAQVIIIVIMCFYHQYISIIKTARLIFDK